MTHSNTHTIDTVAVAAATTATARGVIGRGMDIDAGRITIIGVSG